MRRLILSIIATLAVALSALSQVNIWEGTNVGARVEMTPYVAADQGNAAVIVCPGGSYFWHDMDTEGHAVGRWLQSHGITAFVLKYRAAGIMAFVTHYRLLFRGNRYPDAQEDLLQAVRYVREHREQYGIDPQCIGVMGFSAGGHLVMSSASYFPANELPAFIVPVYPVVTMHEPYVHKRSRRALLGDNKSSNKELREKLSLERNVPDDCPPVFLVNCKDDPIVKYQNSELLDSALTQKNVPHRYLQYATGGHGFGASTTKGTAECRQWKEEFIKWFNELKLK